MSGGHGLSLRGAASSDVGRVRTVNEDAFIVDDDRRLYVVADGMGGHRAGEVASHTAVSTLAASLAARTIWALVAGVRDANGSVLATAVSDPDLRGMGTTLCAVAAVLDESGDDRLGVVNVGDSRVYLLSGGALSQLSEDHSLVEELVREGRLTEEEAESHPRRNVLTRALGVEPGVLVDAWLLEAAPGDRLLLCSDGLVNEVPDTEIARVLGTGAPAEATTAELVRLACEHGGRDNVTCVVVDVLDAPSTPAGPAAERLERVDTDPRAPEEFDEPDPAIGDESVPTGESEPVPVDADVVPEADPAPDTDADRGPDTDADTGGAGGLPVGGPAGVEVVEGEGVLSGATSATSVESDASAESADPPYDVPAPAQVSAPLSAEGRRPMGAAARPLLVAAVVALLIVLILAALILLR